MININIALTKLKASKIIIFTWNQRFLFLPVENIKIKFHSELKKKKKEKYWALSLLDLLQIGQFAAGSDSSLKMMLLHETRRLGEGSIEKVKGRKRRSNKLGRELKFVITRNSITALIR